MFLRVGDNGIKCTSRRARLCQEPRETLSYRDKEGNSGRINKARGTAATSFLIASIFSMKEEAM